MDKLSITMPRTADGWSLNDSHPTGAVIAERMNAIATQIVQKVLRDAMTGNIKPDMTPGSLPIYAQEVFKAELQAWADTMRVDLRDHGVLDAESCRLQAAVFEQHLPDQLLTYGQF